MRDCVKRIVEKSNGAINEKAAKEIIGEVDRAAKRRASEGFDYDDSVTQVLKERMANTKENIIKQKQNIARNFLIKASSVDKISELVDSGLSIVDAFRADLEGIESPVKGARDSLDLAKSSTESAYLSRFLGELNKEGLLGVLNSKTLDDEIGKELWALSNKLENATQNKQAKQIADIIYKTRNAQRLRLNKAGADIGEVGGHIMPQRHDTAEMFKVGEDAWIADMLPLVDETRSFGGDYKDLEATMRSAYQAMITGIRLNDPTLQDAKLFQFSGPSNLGKRLSQARQIHFKDFASWKKWNEKYGMKDLNEGLIDAISYDAKNISLMERYGTNPEAMLNEVIDTVTKKHRKLAAKEGESGIKEKLKLIVDGVLEKNLIPVDPRLATIGSNIRAYNNVTGLGGALLSSVTDLPMKSLEYKFQGKSWLSSTVQPFMDVAYGFKSKSDRVEFSSLMGCYAEGMVGDIGGRFSAQDSLSNKAAKVQRMFFKLNGLSWWTDTGRSSMQKVMSHHLGLKKDTAFDGLDADTQRLFGNYNISPADWDTMRQSVTRMDDGRDYIFPEKINNEKLKEKLIGYYINRSESGVITPTAREQRIATFGTQRGTPIGEFTRLAMQFKSFPITVITKVWGRALYGKGKADVPAIAYLMLMTMAFGYMAGAMKDLLKGKSPKDPTKLETAYAALAQGGGLGILDQVLLQDSTFGRSLSSTLAGPTFGKMDDVFKIYSAGIRGGGSTRQAVMTGVNAIPFNNLFYTRAALDQILLLPMQEQLNPGYLRRMEQNMNKTYGQELLFK